MTDQPPNDPPGAPANSALVAQVPNLERPIELSGTLGVELLLRVHRLTATKGKAWPVLKSVGAIGIVFLIIVAFGLYVGQPAWATWLLAGSFAFYFVMFAALYSIYRYQSSEWAIQRAFQKGSMRPESVVWTVSSEGLATVTETISSRLKWGAFRSIREGENLILIFNRNGTSIVPLAKEFCQSDDDWDRLRQFLRSRLSVDPSEPTSKSN